MKKPQHPSELAAELAKLPPAERYERLIEFPTDHTFKMIGGAEQSFADAVRAALAGLGYPDVDLSLRFSRGGRYVSLTFELHVESGARMAEVYERLNAVPGLQYLL